MRCVVVSVSSADDASSNSQIRPGRNSARAIAIRLGLSFRQAISMFPYLGI